MCKLEETNLPSPTIPAGYRSSLSWGGSRVYHWGGSWGRMTIHIRRTLVCPMWRRKLVILLGVLKMRLYRGHCGRRRILVRRLRGAGLLFFPFGLELGSNLNRKKKSPVDGRERKRRAKSKSKLKKSVNRQVNCSREGGDKQANKKLSNTRCKQI